MARSPSTNGNGTNGKDPKAGKDPKTGRFVAGNTLGAGGSRHAETKRKLQALLYTALTPQRMGKVVRALIRQAEQGEQWAVKEVLDRILGKATQPIDLDGDLRVSFWDVIAKLRDREDTACPPSRN